MAVKMTARYRPYPPTAIAPRSYGAAGASRGERSGAGRRGQQPEPWEEPGPRSTPAAPPRAEVPPPSAFPIGHRAPRPTPLTGRPALRPALPAFPIGYRALRPALLIGHNALSPAPHLSHWAPRPTSRPPSVPFRRSRDRALPKVAVRPLPLTARGPHGLRHAEPPPTFNFQSKQNFFLKRRSGSVVLIFFGRRPTENNTGCTATRGAWSGTKGPPGPGTHRAVRAHGREGAEFTHTAGVLRFGPQSAAGVGLTTSCTAAFLLLPFILAVSELLASENAKLTLVRLCYRAWIEMVLIAVCGNRHISFSSASPLLCPFPTTPKENTLPLTSNHSLRSGLHRQPQPSNTLPINPTALLQRSCGQLPTFQLTS